MIPGLKYLAEAKPGKKTTTTKRQSDELNKDQKYEKRRKREFQASWQTGRPWLKYDDTQGVMFCEWCRNESVQNCKFVSGSNHFRLDAVKDHEASKWHKHYTVKYQAKQGSGAERGSEAEKCLMLLKKADYERMTLKFRTAHAIAKHNRSFLDYKFICKLDKMKGLDVGEQYTHDKAAATIMSYIASATRSEICEKLKNSTFFSLTCDGVTDFTGEELENIYVRICHKGVVEDICLYIGSPMSTSAADVHTFIADTFQTFGLQQDFDNKLIGFCADGASNMQGLFYRFILRTRINVSIM
jgi:hypothetical protein